MRVFNLVLLVSLLTSGPHSRSDDIDMYLGGGSPGGSYVHLLLDVREPEQGAHLCTFGVDCAPPFTSPAAYAHLDEGYAAGDGVTAPGMLKAVLAAVLEKPMFNHLYVMLSISNHENNPADTMDSNLGGGTLLQGYKQLGLARDELLSTLKSIPLLPAATAHVLQPRESYFEWYRYINGGELALGDNTVGNFSLSLPVPDFDTAIISAGNYLSPFKNPDDCPRLYSVMASFGAVSRDDDLADDIASEMAVEHGATLEQMLAHMHQRSTDLLPALHAAVPLQKTWVIASRDNREQADRYARAGNSAASLVIDQPLALERALTDGLSELIAVSATFVPGSVPIYQPGQGGAQSDVFVALFQPGGSVDWAGNLKKLKLLHVAGRGVSWEGPTIPSSAGDIVDVRGEPAFESSGEDKGRIAFNALTFWTDVASLPPGDGEFIPLKADGREVARGGAGQKIDGFIAGANDSGNPIPTFIGDSNSAISAQGYSARQLYVEPASGSEMLAFDANQATLDSIAQLLDPDSQLTPDETLALIKWGRGQDIDNGESGARSWILGDILHSRPLALNYGATRGHSAANPDIRIHVGSGDGLFHIIENTDASGRETGREVFGFYPRELLRNIKLRRDKLLPARQLPYGVDGEPVAFTVDRNSDGTLLAADGDEAYVYFGLRRGGNAYYALDVSNPAATPLLAWKISRTTGGSFDELGMSFSTPVVGKVNYQGASLDVLVFAGGYNGGWNSAGTARRGKDAGAANDAVGNAIYIVNARTGVLVWKAVSGTTGTRSNTHYEHAGLLDAIPSAVTALRSSSGTIHRLYVGDSGGAIWRVDLPIGEAGNDNHRRDNWFISKLADLGSDAGEAGGSPANDLRFFHAPAVVRTFDSEGEFDGVLIQSGNRADPGEAVVANQLFYLKDRHPVTGSSQVKAENESSQPPGRLQADDLVDQTSCITGEESVAGSGQNIACRDGIITHGWKIDYQRPGEKGLSTPLVDGGRVFATTYVPAAQQPCAAQEGEGYAYVVNLADGTAHANSHRIYHLGSGIPAAAVAVGDIILLPGGGIDLYDLDGDGERDVSNLLNSRAQGMYRVYWREPGVDPL